MCRRVHAEGRNTVEQARAADAAGSVDGAAALAAARRAAEKSLELYEYTKVEEPVQQVSLNWYRDDNDCGALTPVVVPAPSFKLAQSSNWPSPAAATPRTASTATGNLPLSQPAGSQSGPAWCIACWQGGLGCIPTPGQVVQAAPTALGSGILRILGLQLCATHLDSRLAPLPQFGSPQLDEVESLRCRLEALARELGAANEEQYARLARGRSTHPSHNGSSHHHNNGNGAAARDALLQLSVDHLVRELQQQHVAQQPAAGEKRNIVPAPSLKPLVRVPADKEKVTAEGTGEEVMLQGFNWDRWAGLEAAWPLPGLGAMQAPAGVRTAGSTACLEASRFTAPVCGPNPLRAPIEQPPQPWLSPCCSWKQHGGWFNHVRARAAEIADLGFTVIWLPPFTQSVSNEVSWGAVESGRACMSRVAGGTATCLPGVFSQRAAGSLRMPALPRTGPPVGGHACSHTLAVLIVPPPPPAHRRATCRATCTTSTPSTALRRS